MAAPTKSKKGGRASKSKSKDKEDLNVTFRMDNRSGSSGSTEDDDSPMYDGDHQINKMYSELSESGVSGHDSMRSARSEATETDGDGVDSLGGSVTNLQDRAAQQTKKTLAREETQAGRFYSINGLGPIDEQVSVCHLCNSICCAPCAMC